jgi:hypothetical protein
VSTKAGGSIFVSVKAGGGPDGFLEPQQADFDDKIGF